MTVASLRLLGYSDQGGRPHGIQIMVRNEHAYIGQAPLRRLQHRQRCQSARAAAGRLRADCARHAEHPPPGPRKPAAGGGWRKSVAIYTAVWRRTTRSPCRAGPAARWASAASTSWPACACTTSPKPTEPRQIGYLDIEGLGLHRIWYDGGRYAYASALLDGYTDHILLIIDMSDPTHPREAGRWWIPGMWRAGGETPSWTSGRVALHHALVADGIAYGSWRDGGLTIVDVHDPAHPELLAHRNWRPPFGGGTHSALPLPTVTC